jgi:hypothetical protein
MSNSVSHEVGTTSSIGAVWPPVPDASHRLRGFYDQGVIETAADCAMFADLSQTAQDNLQEEPSLSRLSIRFITLADRLPILESAGVTLEAAIPLANTETGLVLAYAGHNEGERAVGQARLHAHGQLLQDITARRRIDERDRSQLIRSAGYTAHVIDADTSSSERGDVEEQFLHLYGIFGYDRNGVREILANHANTIVYAADGDRIISTAMAERASIPVDWFGTVEMAEITEASTHPDYRQRGLYKAVSGLLLQRLLERQNDDPLHSVYGESNLAMPGVLIAGHENGRRLSYFDRRRLGVHTQAFGILQQNFHIDDGREMRPYNDFAVSYLPLENQGGTR